MKLLIILFLNTAVLSCFAQKTVQEKDSQEITCQARVPYDEIFSYINKNLKFPKDALENKIEGKVYIDFVIEKDGSFTNFKIVKGISATCDSIALKLMESMPFKGIPASSYGVPVKSNQTLPVYFELSKK